MSLARRTGLTAGLATSIALFLLSGFLGFVPGALGSRRAFDGRRIDAVFQSDPGFYLDEIVSGDMQFGRGVHPVLHLIWRVPLHHLTRLLAPHVPADVTAVWSARLYVAGVAGLGVGWLVAALVRSGVRPLLLLAYSPVWLFATGHVITAVPDHFGISLGVLAAAFAAFLDGRTGPLRPAVLRLLALAALAGGVTVTNVLLPLWLLVVLFGVRVRVRRRHVAVGLGLGLLAVGVGAVGVWAVPGLAERLHDRVTRYLNGRLPGRPLEALAYTGRGLVDPVIGPSPGVVAENEQGIGMVSYEHPPGAYLRWPYDAWQSAAVAVWVVLFGVAVVRLIRADRAAAVTLGGWVGFNLTFHNFWGDEFFLYNPHYSWAVATAAVLGLNGVRWPWMAAATAVITPAQWHTLDRIRDALQAIPA